MARLRVQSLANDNIMKRCRQAADANEISVSSGASMKHGEAEQSHCCVVWGCGEGDIWRKKHFCKRKQFCGVLYVMCLFHCFLRIQEKTNTNYFSVSLGMLTFTTLQCVLDNEDFWFMLFLIRFQSKQRTIWSQNSGDGRNGGPTLLQ